MQILQKRNIFARSPTLDTVVMAEKTIEKYSGEFGKTEIWKKLPKKVMWQTYLLVIDYLLETKLLEKASKVINAPKIIKSNENTKEIEMEFINGKRLSENLNGFSLQEQKNIAKKIGENTTKIHDEHIIHGDLTTSNMILLKDKLFFIDFGLGYISQKYEDKAVDLHLLKQALIAKHYKNAEILFNEIIKNYKKEDDIRIK